jgi:hypothetical protein
LDFKSIWQRQHISGALALQIAQTSELVYTLITHPPAGHENVTQWCKREECWLGVKDAIDPLSAELISELVAPEEARSSVREARIQQKVDAGIDAQAAIVGLGSEYWKALLTWGVTRQLVSPEDQRLIGIAAGSSTSGIPSDRQSKRLLDLKDRLEREGFAPAAVSNLTGT